VGKLAFYLEALDRDVRNPHEQPAIGFLLCASKDKKWSNTLSAARFPRR
jgi:YhcG PDDEXK nuclease domain